MLILGPLFLKRYEINNLKITTNFLFRGVHRFCAASFIFRGGIETVRRVQNIIKFDIRRRDRAGNLKFRVRVFDFGNSNHKCTKST